MGFLACRGELIEARPGVVRRVGLRKHHVQTESDVQGESPGEHWCSLKLKTIS